MGNRRPGPAVTTTARALVIAALCVSVCLHAAPAAAAVTTASATQGGAAPAAAADNPIVVENSQSGSFGWMHGPLLGDDTNGQIKGDWSGARVKPSGTDTLYVSVNPDQTFPLDLYRLRWYRWAR